MYINLGLSLILSEDYLVDVLRGTRPLNRREARSISGTLRTHCGSLFEPPGVRDVLAQTVLDGFRQRLRRGFFCV